MNACVDFMQVRIKSNVSGAKRPFGSAVLMRALFGSATWWGAALLLWSLWRGPCAGTALVPAGSLRVDRSYSNYSHSKIQPLFILSDGERLSKVRDGLPRMRHEFRKNLRNDLRKSVRNCGKKSPHFMASKMMP